MNVSDLGEDGLVELIRDWTASPSAEVILGAGDDAAILKGTGDREILVSTDAFLEGVHFRTDLLRPDEIGHRVMTGTLSDLAAMGGVGVAAFVNLHAPPDTSVDFVRGLYRGMDRVASACGVRIAGGDTVRGDLALDVTAIGTVAAGRAVCRDGANVGDVLCVSGMLGRSEAGRRLLSGEFSGSILREFAAEAEAAHRAPAPRFDVARLLGNLPRRTTDIELEEEKLFPARPTAMMDVSDGLAIDLGRLCRASGVGCRVEAGLVPVDEAARWIARREGKDELALALGGGEDWELLFTMRPGDLDLLWESARAAGVVVTSFGQITEARSGLVLVREDGREEGLPRSGWDHFAPAG